MPLDTSGKNSHGALPNLSIILPTYNERENIRIFVPLLHKKFSGVPHEIIVVDDSSPDGTGAEVLALAKEIPNLRLVSRREKSGIGSALRDGYNNAVNDIILSSDADLSISPDDLMKLYEKIAAGDYDMVVGSRYIAASTYNMPHSGAALQYIVSRVGNRALRMLFRMPIHDFSVNCRAMRREVWHSIETREHTNFFLFEMIYLAQKANARIGEIPITFSGRKYGRSKINYAIEIPKAVYKMVSFFLFR